MNRISGWELRARREHLGITSETLAGLLGVRHDTLRRWEHGRDPAPYRIGQEVGEIEDTTNEWVSTVERELRDPAAGDWLPGGAEAVIAKYGGRWWRHVVIDAWKRVGPDGHGVDWLLETGPKVL